MSFILSIDQGTTGTTSALIDTKTFKFVGKVGQEYPQIYPKPSWVEHNLNDIWETTQNTIVQVLKKCNASPADIVGIGLTNQRETTCAFSKNGEPLYNAIVWQDRRTSSFCEQITQSGDAKEITQKTGLPVDPYFSASKMKWLLDNSDKVKRHANNGDLRFGTIDTFLLYKLSGHRSHFTESSNASRTLLMNIESGQWDQELCRYFGIDPNFLPEIKDSFSDFGQTSSLSFLPDGIPIYGILGDQQSALFGQACYKKGSLKCTYGTGAFMLANTGKELKRSEHGLLTTVAYQYKNELFYALEGSCYIAGAAVQWLRDNLKFFPESSDIEAMAKKVANLNEMENVLFLPFFSGLGSPYWKSEAKGAIIGLTRDTHQGHIARACLDGIALSIHDLLASMTKDFGEHIAEMKVDGGAVNNNLLMEIQASVSKLKVIRPEVIETTAYGAALACAIGSGHIDFDGIKELWKEDRTFEPINNLTPFYETKYHQWENAIKRLYL